jgi:hypothetical protein
MKTKSAWIGMMVLVSILFSLPMDIAAQGKKNGPPPWAPAHGYRAKTRQVYFPDQNFYFDTQKGVYIYLNGKNWEVSAKLPSIFGGIDLNVAAKVELDLDTDTPQKFNAAHQTKYKKKGKEQKGKEKGSEKGKSKK